MKRNTTFKLTIFFIVMILSTGMVSYNEPILNREFPIANPLYSNIWGTIYHAEVRQCDASPTITGDGSRINPYNASEHRWIAISQEMLDCEYRVGLLNDSTSPLYKGKIEYGDTIWIDSPYPEINGWWIVHDTKNKRYRNTIDFLQTKNDKSLYNNNPKWSGRFNNIKIYSVSDAKLLGLNMRT